MINKVVLIGRLTKDPEVKYLQGGYAVASFTLAIDRSFKDKDGKKEADFIPVVVWRKTAELVEKYAVKGDMIGVVGRLQTRTYEGKDGTKKYITEVVADEVQFFSNGKSFDDRKDNAKEDILAGFEEIDEDNVPF